MDEHISALEAESVHLQELTEAQQTSLLDMEMNLSRSHADFLSKEKDLKSASSKLFKITAQHAELQATLTAMRQTTAANNEKIQKYEEQISTLTEANKLLEDENSEAYDEISQHDELEKNVNYLENCRRDLCDEIDAVFFSWLQTSVGLCGSGSQIFLGKVGLMF